MSRCARWDDVANYDAGRIGRVSLPHLGRRKCDNEGRPAGYVLGSHHTGDGPRSHHVSSGAAGTRQRGCSGATERTQWRTGHWTRHGDVWEWHGRDPQHAVNQMADTGRTITATATSRARRPLSDAVKSIPPYSTLGVFGHVLGHSCSNQTSCSHFGLKSSEFVRRTTSSKSTPSAMDVSYVELYEIHLVHQIRPSLRPKLPIDSARSISIVS